MQARGIRISGIMVSVIFCCCLGGLSYEAPDDGPGNIPPSTSRYTKPVNQSVELPKTGKIDVALLASLIRGLLSSGCIQAEGAEAKIADSVANSNSPKYQSRADKAYDALVDKGSWGASEARPPVLFLEGMKEEPMPGSKRESFAMALVKEGVVIVSREEYDKVARDKGEQAATKWLALKIAHEATHVKNHQEGCQSPLKDEALATEAGYRALDDNALEKGTMKNLTAAFNILSSDEKKAVLCTILGIDQKQYNNVRYGGVVFPGNDYSSKTIGIIVGYSAGGQKTVTQCVYVNTETNYIYANVMQQRQGGGK